MNEVFVDAFNGMFVAIIKIFIVALIAGIMVRKKILKDEYIKGLSEVTVKVLLPALVFSNVTTTFDPVNTHNWWILPIVGLITPIIFLVFIVVLYLPKIKENISKFPLATFQNSGYLVLPIGQILYPDKYDEFALYVFLLILGFNISLWSIGKLLVTKTDEDKKVKLFDLITPPLVANVFALSLVFLKLNRYIPDIVATPVNMLGSATVPIATFVLGATIGSISFRQLPKLSDLLKIGFVKYFVLPASFIAILYFSGIYKTNPLLSDFLIIEASAAPAANLIVIVKKYGGNDQQTGSIMFIMYFAAILVMPIIIAFWKFLIS